MVAKNTKNLLLNVCVLLVLWSNSAGGSHKTDWTFAIYMEAGTPDMHSWLLKNMDAMALATSNAKKLNIVTQVHLEGSEAWRYVIRQNAISPQQTVTISSDGGQNIVDFMKWAVKKHPANHYGLILWGHGFGLLDPTHRPTSVDFFAWDVDPDEPGHECTNGVCPLKSQDLISNHFLHRSYVDSCSGCSRGLLFTDAHTFVNNASLVATLKAIKETVLKGNKLDILGTDCCKMAMLEVGYQVKDFATFLVGSQNCEMKDGWNYQNFFSCFNEPPVEAATAAQAIVKTYGDYYEKHTVQNTYTISALDLSHLTPLVANLNEVATLSKKLLTENKAAFKALLINARMASPSMCQASYYLDLASVYANLLEELNKPEAAAVANAAAVAALKNVLAQGQELIKAVVAANVTGTAVQNMHGISFYFPRNVIDASYLLTPFAQETAWLGVLQEVIG
jgi:hypothetical protein